jgi:hypothetical protein
MKSAGPVLFVVSTIVLLLLMAHTEGGQATSLSFRRHRGADIVPSQTAAITDAKGAPVAQPCSLGVGPDGSARVTGDSGEPIRR